MQRVTLVMKSGHEVDLICEDASIKQNGYGQLSSLTLKGTQGRHFLYIKLDDVSSVLYEEITTQESVSPE